MCQVITNIDERRELLKKQGRCFNGLRRGGGGDLARKCNTKSNVSALSAVVVTIWQFVTVPWGTAVIIPLAHLHCILVLGFITINSNYQIDLLIGSDYIWDFFDSKAVRRRKSGQGGTAVSWLLLQRLDGCCRVRWKISRGRNFQVFSFRRLSY